jgi:signal transduction histidine kinase
MVGTDPQLLERLLSPVVANAARYAVHEVEVSAGAADGHVRVVLADDGPGVAAEDRECVFQPGWRGEPADGHAGAGLGLALARRLGRVSQISAADGEMVGACRGLRC